MWIQISVVELKMPLGSFSGVLLFCSARFLPIPSWISEALGEGVPVDLQFCDLAQERGTDIG